MPDRSAISTLIQILFHRHDCVTVHDALTRLTQPVIDQLHRAYEEVIVEFRAMSQHGQEKFLQMLAQTHSEDFQIQFTAVALADALLPPALTEGVALPANAKEIVLRELAATMR